MPESMRLFVSEADRQESAKWLRASNTRRSHAERGRIVLLSAEGLTAEAIGAQFDVVPLSVYSANCSIATQTGH
jgi:hypothetical protein